MVARCTCGFPDTPCDGCRENAASFDRSFAAIGAIAIIAIIAMCLGVGVLIAGLLGS